MDSRNRLWWVMGGVALLLVVVLTGGLYWLRPVDSVARADLALPRPRQDAQPFEYVAVPGASVASAPEAAPDAAPAPAEDAAARSQPLPAHQPRPRVTLDTQAPASPAATPEVRAIATTSARSGAAPAVLAAPAIATPAAAVKRSVPLAKLAPKSPLHEFWVQVGSFASRARATALEQRLSDQGIVSRVTTRPTDTEVFFRVRVGPYGSRDEAQKFLAWVQHVDGMDGSYISEVRNARG